MEKQIFSSAGSTFESVGINCQQTNEQEKSHSKCKKNLLHFLILHRSQGMWVCGRAEDSRGYLFSLFHHTRIELGA